VISAVGTILIEEQEQVNATKTTSVTAATILLFMTPSPTFHSLPYRITATPERTIRAVLRVRELLTGRSLVRQAAAMKYHELGARMLGVGNPRGQE
jgi:hypothetical protein